MKRELQKAEDISTAVVHVISSELNLPKTYSTPKALCDATVHTRELSSTVLTLSIKLTNLVYAMKYAREKRVTSLHNVRTESCLDRLLAKSKVLK